MSANASSAIQAVAFFTFLSIAAYSFTSCVRDGPAINRAEIECIKQKGNWSGPVKGCSFTYRLVD